ncbi:alpha/beta fold hydrolase [Nonomuraea sp. KM88]|uniref:alpha/beta fold hydrolase n=1 Tax=Nonomuraea sp. KM88 TaxID=3457427 RepID=UPI003FCDACA7
MIAEALGSTLVAALRSWIRAGWGSPRRCTAREPASTSPSPSPPAPRAWGRGAYFTADQASHDLDAIRRALGLGKVSFYGNSCGTLYAQAYAARYPAGLDAIFLDSSVVVNRDGYASWKNYWSRLRQLDLVCARSKACDALPGSATDAWTRLVDRLRKRPDPEVSVFQTVALSNVWEPVFGREATAAADAYLHGDPAPLHRLARLIPAALPPANDAYVAGYLGFRCGDGTFPFDRRASAAERQVQAERYYERARPLGPYRITDIFPSGIGSVEPCIYWPTPRHSPPRPPGLALPAVPVLVMAGEIDQNSPAEVARSLRAFPNATVVRVPFGPHALTSFASPMGDCVRGMLRTFLTTRQVSDSQCTGENYRALGAFPKTVGDVPPQTARNLSVAQRRVLAATFATAADATARHNPNGHAYTSVRDEAGLRGGLVTFGQDITLDEVRFVRDLRVSGPIKLTPEGRATATLRAETGGRTHEVALTWAAFSTRPSLSGTFDGVPFGQ